MITIVSGLPRSGTSLMMQMLAAGGLPVLTDGQREKDVDNPRGYYEWEPIKTLPQAPGCLAEAEGKAVKVISSFLFSLPEDNDYRIIFMRRPLPEVLASQAEMIRRRGTTGSSLAAPALMAALQAHLNQVSTWLERRPQRVCRIDYHTALREPLSTAQAVQTFLNIPLHVEAMAQQVDWSLYRQKAPARVEGQSK
ncbi:MAG TPA: sulfotransferase family protein [Terriglobia bacterium]|nr:sulfotransferase family protein [Terriglobia bacterium]